MIQKFKKWYSTDGFWQFVLGHPHFYDKQIAISYSFFWWLVMFFGLGVLKGILVILGFIDILCTLIIPLFCSA